MKIIAIIVLILATYLMGNVSPATLLAHASGHDIKREGSGNAGTTNVLRVVGRKAAIITLIVDVGKGFIATMIGYLVTLDIFNYRDHPSAITVYYGVIVSGICGLAVFLGHVWPVILDFKGGKGVATALGVLLATDWKIALICFALFLVVVAITKYVSLGSLSAAVYFLLLFVWHKAVLGQFMPKGVEFYMRSQTIEIATKFLILFPYVIMVVILFYKHRDNIKRIVDGSENKLSLSKLTNKENDKLDK